MKIHASFLSTCYLALVVLQSVIAVNARYKDTKPGGGSKAPHNEKPKLMIENANYEIGLGIADITGPSVQVNLMGYGAVGQIGTGIHQRQRSRAFIVVDPETKQRIVYVSADICMGGQAVRRGVLKGLEKLYGNMYNKQNVAISGTHTHAGPAGFLQYALFQVTSLGYIPQCYQAIVDGIILSIKRAHANLTPGSIHVGSADVIDGNINRSPYAYDNNPEEERARYAHNTDHEMTQLNFVDTDGKTLGVFNWYPVHCTSMYENNTLISGDNKGYASYLLERIKNPPGTLPGNGSFVAAFAQANVGDTSPNTLGARCEDTGLPCDYAKSTCGNPQRSQKCMGHGPGWPNDFLGFDSTKIIGTRQVDAAVKILNGQTTQLKGPIGAIHQDVDMPRYTFSVNNASVRLCKPALGYSFAGGTTDGPGQFDFTQSDNSTGNPFWNLVRDAISQPSAQQNKCHGPKPIILNTGEMNTPYAWSASIVDTQILRLGQFVLIVFPGEATIMAGRRMRETVKNALISQGKLDNDSVVVLTGPSNTYTHYVTTKEEYEIQRYEGASNIYGPNTLSAYQKIYTDLATALFSNQTVPSGPPTPDLTIHAIKLVYPPPMDVHPMFKPYGHVVTDTLSTYPLGSTATAVFIAGNPRNDLQLEGTYLTVEQKQKNGSWSIVRTDGDWSTKFLWVKEALGLAGSQATIQWEIEQDTPPGTYRLGYFGHDKRIDGSLNAHNGYSSEFKVVSGM